jgi:hypothetical protein
MVKATTKVIRTLDGKYVGQVRRFELDRTIKHYETPEYLTYTMADADAKCWMEFHMTEVVKPVEALVEAPVEAPVENKRKFDISATDTVRTGKSRNGVPNRLWTGAEFTGKLFEWYDKFPEMTFRCGEEDDNGRVAGEGSFFIAVRKLPTARQSWYIVTSGS